MMNAANERIELLKKYLAEDPTDNFSQYALALEYEKQNNRADAIELLQQLINRQPDYLACYYQLGKMQEAEGQQLEAILIFQRGIEIARIQKNQKTLSELQSALDILSEE